MYCPTRRPWHTRAWSSSCTAVQQYMAVPPPGAEAVQPYWNCWTRGTLSLFPGPTPQTFPTAHPVICPVLDWVPHGATCLEGQHHTWGACLGRHLRMAKTGRKEQRCLGVPGGQLVLQCRPKSHVSVRGGCGGSLSSLHEAALHLLIK